MRRTRRGRRPPGHLGHLAPKVFHLFSTAFSGLSHIHHDCHENTLRTIRLDPSFENMFDWTSKHSPTDTVKRVGLTGGPLYASSEIPGWPFSGSARVWSPEPASEWDWCARPAPGTARNRLAIRRRTSVGNSGISKDSIMRSHRLARRVAAYAGGAAVVAMVGLTAACGSSSDKAPETTTPRPPPRRRRRPPR